MKNHKLLIFVFTIFIFSSLMAIDKNNSKSTIASDKYEGLVIISINNLDSETYIEIQKELGKENNSNLEYGCVENGILVIKFFNSHFSTNADNSKMIQNQISKSVGKKEFKVILVKVNTYSGSTKC